MAGTRVTLTRSTVLYSGSAAVVIAGGSTTTLSGGGNLVSFVTIKRMSRWVRCYTPGVSLTGKGRKSCFRVLSLID